MPTDHLSTTFAAIREIDATGMLVEVSGPYGPRGSQRIDFSPYAEYGSTAA